MQTTEFTAQYIDFFIEATKGFEATMKDGSVLKYADAIGQSVQWVNEAATENKKIILIGNGGSASICSHLAVDFWKNAKVKATSFNDSSLLTCVGNDCGYEEVFAKPIQMFAESNDVVICISSSGNSPNIIKGCEQALLKGAHIITLTAFATDNILRSKGDLNFYVPTFSYGFAEVLHTLIVHNMLDAKMYLKDKVNIFQRNQLL